MRNNDLQFYFILYYINYYFYLFGLRRSFFGTATDVAGEVIGVGSEVKDFKAGDKVVAILNHLVCAH